MPISPGQGQIGGSLIGGLASAYGAAEANKAARHERRMAQHFIRRQQLESPTRISQGLERAGLNRILAVTGGGSGFQSSATASAAPQENIMAGAEGAFTASAKIALEQKQVKSNIKAVDAQAGKTNIEAQILKGNVPKSKFKKDVGDDFYDGYKSMKKKLKGYWNKWTGNTGSSAKQNRRKSAPRGATGSF